MQEKQEVATKLSQLQVRVFIHDIKFYLVACAHITYTGADEK